MGSVTVLTLGAGETLEGPTSQLDDEPGLLSGMKHYSPITPRSNLCRHVPPATEAGTFPEPE